MKTDGEEIMEAVKEYVTHRLVMSDTWEKSNKDFREYMRKQGVVAEEDLACAIDNALNGVRK